MLHPQERGRGEDGFLFSVHLIPAGAGGFPTVLRVCWYLLQYPDEEAPVQATDPFSQRYADMLDGTYDCVDRIVLNGYFRFIQSSGGFRTWWQQLFGHDDDLDNAHFIRFAGRFARRVRCAAKQKGIPVIDKKSDDRIHEIAEELRPTARKFKGLFCITVHRAPNSVWGVIDCGRGGPHLKRKDPKPYVNHYAFHIQDPDWGHVTIKVCPHPPFNIQVILNGHEYVANQATKKNIATPWRRYFRAWLTAPGVPWMCGRFARCLATSTARIGVGKGNRRDWRSRSRDPRMI
jgi:hypothetical protein